MWKLYYKNVINGFKMYVLNEGVASVLVSEVHIILALSTP